VIVEGRVDVLQAGTYNSEGVSEYFGEIARLRDTASGNGACPHHGHGAGIDRETFLVAVGSHPRSRLHAERTAAERLSAPPRSIYP
jgi:hypothetical protein